MLYKDILPFFCKAKFADETLIYITGGYEEIFWALYDNVECSCFDLYCLIIL